MKQWIFIIAVLAVSCCSTKTKTSDKQGNTNTADSSFAANASLPGCVNEMIARFRAEEKQHPPRKVFSYTYKGKTVYYVPAICCDFYSDLYDSNCKLIGHPDGGYTGKGDGKLPDFNDTRTNEKLLWADERK